MAALMRLRVVTSSKARWWIRWGGFQSGLESWKLQAENGPAFLTVTAEIYTSELR
jgi:hypothetical protein